jgi:hypothetical protein
MRNLVRYRRHIGHRVAIKIDSLVRTLVRAGQLYLSVAKTHPGFALPFRLTISLRALNSRGLRSSCAGVEFWFALLQVCAGAFFDVAGAHA